MFSDHDIGDILGWFFGPLDYDPLRKLQQTAGTCPRPINYPCIFVFWGLFQGSVGIFLGTPIA